MAFNFRSNAVATRKHALMRNTPPPLGFSERLRWIQKARSAFASEKQLTSAMKARGLLALHKAEERLRCGTSGL